MHETSGSQVLTFKVRNLEGPNQVSGPPCGQTTCLVLTRKAPKTDTQLVSFLGFAYYYREFNEGYADKIHPMQYLTRNKGKNASWTDEDQVSFENIKHKLSEAPVLNMPTEKGCSC